MVYNLKLPKMREIEVKASIWKRIFAFIIDLAIINLLIITPFEGQFKNMPSFDNFDEQYSFYVNNNNLLLHYSKVFLAISVLALLYFAILEHKFGQTVGKMLMKIYVKPKEISFFKAILRNLFILPFFPFIILWIVDPILALTSKDGQRLEERFTQTMVVEKRYI